MALPIGHAAVGLATAAIVARATGTDPTAQMWIGAFIASGIPDLDMILIAMGFRGPTYHRNASHSFLVLALVSTFGWFMIESGSFPVDPEIRWIWIAALFTHPLVDYFTTGPGIRDRGYAIPLWWPVSRKRFYSPRRLYDSLEIEKAKNLGDVWDVIRPEITHLALPAALIIAATLLI